MANEQAQTSATVEARAETSVEVERYSAGAIDWANKKLVEIIKNTVARDLTNNEFFVFRMYCESSGLNPLRKEIRCWRDGRSNSLVVQAGIDGFRRIAFSHPEFAGMTAPKFEFEQDGKTPISCTVEVHRRDWQLPAVATVWFEEVARKSKDPSKPSSWDRMPRLMLAKVAEAHAIRKAFPQQLANMYSDDEPIEIDYTRMTDFAPEPGSVADEVNRARFIYNNLELLKLPEASQKIAAQLISKAGGVFDKNTNTWVCEVRIPKLERFEVKL